MNVNGSTCSSCIRVKSNLEILKWSPKLDNVVSAMARELLVRSDHRATGALHVPPRKGTTVRPKWPSGNGRGP